MRAKIFFLAIFLMAALALIAQGTPHEKWSAILDFFDTQPEMCCNIAAIDSNIYLIVQTLGIYPYPTKLAQVTNTGQVVWTRDLLPQTQASLSKQLGVTPDNNLVVANEGIVHKINPLNGEDIWTHDLSNYAANWQLCTANHLLCLDMSHIIALDYASGDSLGIITIPGGYYSVDSDNVNIMYIGKTESPTYPFASSVNKIAVNTNSTPWSYQILWTASIIGLTPTVLLANGVVYELNPRFNSDGEFLSVNLDQLELLEGGRIWVNYADYSIYQHLEGAVINNNGDIILYGAHRDNLQEMMVCHSFSDGTLAWSFNPPPPAGCTSGTYKDAVWHNDQLICVSTITAAAPDQFPDYLKISAVSTVTANDDAAIVPSVNNISCYPNPFRDNTTIKFKQIVNGPTTITVYNIKGQLIKTLTDQPFNSGEHDVTWDGKDDQGQRVSPGLYLYKVKSGTFCTSGKMILMK